MNAGAEKSCLEEVILAHDLRHHRDTTSRCLKTANDKIRRRHTVFEPIRVFVSKTIAPRQFETTQTFQILIKKTFRLHIQPLASSFSINFRIRTITSVDLRHERFRKRIEFFRRQSIEMIPTMKDIKG